MTISDTTESMFVPTSLTAAARRTFRLDMVRSMPTGFLEACTQSFFHLIALRAFHAPSYAKSLILTGPHIGLLCTPLIVHRVRRASWGATRVAACVSAFGAAALAVALVWRATAAFVVLVMLGGFALNAIIPLFTAAYQANYPPNQRGRLVAYSVMARVTVGGASGLVVGWVLGRRISSWPWVIGAAAGAMGVAALALWAMTSRPLPAEGSQRITAGFGYLRTDRALRTTMISWMFAGIANLMFIPLRTEFLGNERYGRPFAALWITALTITIPAATRVVFAPLYGRVFDRASFFVTRMVVNTAFGISIAGFLLGRSKPGLVLAAVLYGIALSGGDILWQLWATRLAPDDRVADYMALHTFFTGIRGVMTPFLAFWLLEHSSPRAIAVFAVVMIAIATGILLPDARRDLRGDRVIHDERVASLDPTP